jgi:hypothetical protein
LRNVVVIGGLIVPFVEVPVLLFGGHITPFRSPPSCAGQ